MKRKHYLIVLAIMFVLVGVWWLWLSSAYNRAAKFDCAIKLSGDCIKMELADTSAAREQGLSGRTGLAPNDGMLFDFEEPQLVCMWMKDMAFAIDMVWIDENRNIMRIQEDVKPETYPDSFCEHQTRYVIELKSGVAKEAELSVGQKLQF